MAQAITTRAAELDERSLEARRLLYSPWVLLGFVPTLTLTTVTLGTAAILLAPFDQRAAHHCGTIWAWLLCRANFTRVRVTGMEHADPSRSYVIMSNHQSHFDVLAFYGHFVRQFRWVMKKELRRIPVFGAGCAAQGHIFIDRSNRERAIESLRDAQRKLRPGVSVMIFPEGSRSRDGKLGTFKKGGFMMALEMGLPVLPVSISGTRHILPGKSMKLLPGKACITVHPPIDSASYGIEGRDRLMADVRASIASGLTEWERS